MITSEYAFKLMLKTSSWPTRTNSAGSILCPLFVSGEPADDYQRYIAYDNDDLEGEVEIR